MNFNVGDPVETRRRYTHIEDNEIFIGIVEKVIKNPYMSECDYDIYCVHTGYHGVIVTFNNCKYSYFRNNIWIEGESGVEVVLTPISKHGAFIKLFNPKLGTF
jgi:hypothetical protein